MSLFDDWEHSASQPSYEVYREQQTREDDFADTPYVKASLQKVEETAMFSLEKLDFAPLAAGRFGAKQVVTANDILVVAREDCKVFHYNLIRGSLLEYDIPRRDEEIYKIHVDVTGNHVLVSMTSGDNYYIHPSLPKARKLDKMTKGILIESVGWDKVSSNDTSTGNILIGTNTSAIYETRLESKDGLKLWRLAYDLREHASEEGAITGLEVEQFPMSQSYQVAKFFVMATTSARCYQFVGGPNFESLFSSYQGTPSFNELPGSLRTSGLHFFSKPQSSAARKDKRRLALPTTFAWQTGAGIYHGQLFFTAQASSMDSSGDSVIGDYGLMGYDPLAGGAASPYPLSVNLTEFHLLALYADRIQILSHPPGLCTSLCKRQDAAALRSKIVFEEEFRANPARWGLIRGMCRDPVTNSVWIYSHNSVFELVANNEDRDAWRLYLERACDPINPMPEHFDTALRYCKDDPSKRDRVLCAKGDFFFAQGNYEVAAEVYARTQKSFEEVTLSFIAQGARDALKGYLLRKLEVMYERAQNKQQDATQLTCITTWLTEIYLDKINALKDAATAAAAIASSPSLASASSSSGANSMQAAQHAAAATRERYSAAITEFRQFLDRYKDRPSFDSSGSRVLILDPTTTFNLIASHGQTEEMLHYALLIEDYERVIAHYVTAKEYEEAVRVLSKHCCNKRFVDLYYKFSPILMQNAPFHTVNAWIRAASFLEPGKLIPALMRYDPARNPQNVEENQAIRCLQHFIQREGGAGSRDPAIHNFLLSLYAKQKDDSELLQFLSQKDPCFDSKYALRLCTENGKMLACVQIYGSMGLFEDAVELALKVGDLSLAKYFADRPEDDDALRKKLWLSIARHAVEVKQDVRLAIDYLKECELLKIEDILPFFPDFTAIDDFKQEICESLEDYNRKIEELRSEMDDATLNAEMIRSDIKDLRSRCGHVEPGARCDLCSQPLLQQAFYLFAPCQHSFHARCLIDDIGRNSTADKRSRIRELLAQCERLSMGGGAGAGGGAAASRSGGNRSALSAAALSSPDLSFEAAAGAGAAAAGSPSPAEEAQSLLDDMVASECVLCGRPMIRSIDRPFVSDEDHDEVESWRV